MNYRLLLILFLLWMVVIFMRANTIENFEEHKYTPDELFTHLKYITDILEERGIKHWIMYGTLLGGIRNSDIIPYDYDFDLGANIDDVERILELNNLVGVDGYEIIKPKTDVYDYDSVSKTRSEWRVSLKVNYKNVPMGDIYLYKKCSDGYLRRYDSNNGLLFYPQTIFHSFFTDNLSRVQIRNSYFWAPANPDFLLKYWYGEDWMIPIKSRSLGGKTRSDKDYYGGDINMNINTMIKFLEIKNIYDTPQLDSDIHLIFPPEQKSWQIANDPVTMK